LKNGASSRVGVSRGAASDVPWGGAPVRMYGRRTWVPSALIDQMSFASAENTILPVRDRMAIGADEGPG
jgi:hypothetical protein